jgi:hypothetical protein
VADGATLLHVEDPKPCRDIGTINTYLYRFILRWDE